MLGLINIQYLVECGVKGIWRVITNFHVQPKPHTCDAYNKFKVAKSIQIVHKCILFNGVGQCFCISMRELLVHRPRAILH